MRSRLVELRPAILRTARYIFDHKVHVNKMDGSCLRCWPLTQGSPHYNPNIDARYTNIVQTWTTLDRKANNN